MILLQDVPSGYEYCLSGKDKCPRAATCLRSIAAQLLSESEEAPSRFLRVVNPLYLDTLSDLSACDSYRDSTPLRYAKGMTRLFDEVPTKQLYEVRNRVIACFSCRRYFYHSRKGERLITLAEQQRIAAVFKNAGLSLVPRFDGYEYVLNW
ncbi:MAG: DUF6078 family protein [Bacteroides sp.]|nr:DUF6078 family protein [Bacteroides sp.]